MLKGDGSVIICIVILIFYSFTPEKEKIAIKPSLTTEMPEYGTNETDYPDSYPDCYPDCPPPEYPTPHSCDSESECEGVSSNETAKHEIPDIKETPTEGKYT